MTSNNKTFPAKNLLAGNSAKSMTSEGNSPLLPANRELKQRQRRRQRERHEFVYLVGKNNSFARPARAFFTFVHFVAVVSKTTT